MAITKKKNRKEGGSDKKVKRPPSLTPKEYQDSKKRGAGKMGKLRLKYGFTQPPDTTAIIWFLTDGADEYTYLGSTHEIYPNSKNFRKFLCNTPHLDQESKKADTACRKGVPRKPFSAFAIYLEKVVDANGEVLKTYKTSKGTQKLSGLKFLTPSGKLSDSIMKKRDLKGLEGRPWLCTREGAGRDDTSYELEGDDPKKMPVKVKSSDLSFFDEMLASMTYDEAKQKDELKNWKPPSDSDRMPDDDEERFDAYDLKDKDRAELKAIIREFDADFTFKKKHTDDYLRSVAEQLFEQELEDSLDEDDL